ncbi:MAG: tRNA adenosine(34) deaminase TadA [Clostridia bacterium]|nr:tRNA adenosine(34) deaminase TadA [Clostridia bacterium]MDD4798581.1 tRNA adenosine(34) deaminase TadA [Clostridia bacterium]
MSQTHQDYMLLALDEAQKALHKGEVPVGAVAVFEGRVIASAGNCVEEFNDGTRHAELELLRKAAAVLGRRRLDGVTVYVTLEPCAMCAGAMVLARIDRLVFAADDPKAGACGSIFNIVGHPALNHHPEVIAGICAAEATELLKRFFNNKRKNNPPLN